MLPDGGGHLSRVVQLPASPRVRRWLRRLVMVVGWACVVLAFDLARVDQGDCTGGCIPAIRGLVCGFVAMGCGMLSLTVAARRSGLLLAMAGLIGGAVNVTVLVMST